jgi:hypothetical protein
MWDVMRSCQQRQFEPLHEKEKEKETGGDVVTEELRSVGRSVGFEGLSYSLTLTLFLLSKVLGVEI